MSGSNSKIHRTNTQIFYIIICAWFLFIVRILSAQTVPAEQAQPAILAEEITPTDSTRADTIAIFPTVSQKPYLGIVFGRDLDFEKAEKLHYPYNYGAYIDKIEPGGPADKAGLKEGDIITRFDEEKIWYNDYLVRTLENYPPEATVPVVLYRDGKAMKTTITLDDAPKPVEIKISEPEEPSRIDYSSPKKTGIIKSSDCGIFSWDFIFYVPDNLEFYDQFLQTQLGYPSVIDNRQVNDKTYSGLNMTGFHFRPGDSDGALNWGIFWANNNWNRHKQISYGGADHTSYLIHSINYWGITLDRQITVFRRLYLTAGVLAGSLTNGLAIHQSEPLTQWGEIGARFTDTDENYLRVERKYFLLQPNLSLYIPILGDFGLQAKFGYCYGIPRSEGWKVPSPDGDKTVLNSPNTSIGGYTFSIGPAILLK